jgi:predicted dehydrogenase
MEIAMSKSTLDEAPENAVDSHRRGLLKAAGAGVLAAAFSNVTSAGTSQQEKKAVSDLRWGIVGTGGIANSMAGMIKQADHAQLGAVSSRKMASAREFADKHGVPAAFDSWLEMCQSDGVDAIYVATPTSVREEICIAAANHGKHVLGEKPFASLASVQRIAAACRSNGVGFMDGTHFVHHPRTHHIKAVTAETVGWPWSIDSAFQFGLNDKGNIRYNTSLEPYGAIGDAGWYNMRVAVEYASPGVEIKSVEAFLRRDKETGAAVSGSGVIVFDDGSTTTWNCGFESGAGIMDLRISGTRGVIKLDDFLVKRPSGQPADYEYRQNWNDTRQIEVASAKRGAVLMFEDFATMIGEPEKMEASMQATSRTQQWLDAIWQSALKNERG